jgi:transcription antitermination factor NusG
VLNWFVVQTAPQRETFVSEQLSSVEPYLPQFKNERGRIEPLFRSYLFVPETPYWSAIKNTVGVLCLLMTGEQPARLNGSVIAFWRAKERLGLVQLPPPPKFKIGQRLTILSGTLRHRTVIYAGMSTKDRERVLIEMLGQTVTLTVPTEDLAPEFVAPPRFGLRRNREPLMEQRAGRFSRSYS